ncbi:hypothetical protein NDA07_04390 [Microcoleus vaginatus DQ-U2]|uniref:hypothetical protein n=1 Tax=Microcoleus vaginatus TaxID=119532 RepID=UPI001683BA9D|nr:hypothetical protein [Microcoleus sp. FACHB-DQ6]
MGDAGAIVFHLIIAISVNFRDRTYTVLIKSSPTCEALLCQLVAFVFVQAQI